jgi:cytochrome c551/c552
MRYLIPAAILFTGLLAVTTPGNAKPEYMKKEKKACAHCHTTAKGPELNDIGKFYKEHKTLEGAPEKK